MKKLLMIGTSLLSKEMVQYAKSIGVYTIVADPDEVSRSGAKMAADETWEMNVADIDNLEKKCREEGVTAVICGISEFCLEVCMELCKRLGFPCYCTPEAWHFSRDKADFKELCRRIGAPVAKDYFISKNLTDEELEKVDFPVVVKPVDLSGNRGISYCYNKEELKEAYQYALSVSKSDKIVVEKLLVGKEWYSNYAIVDGEIRLLSLNSMIAEPGQLKNLYSLTTTVSDNVERFVNEINPKIEEVLREVGCKDGLAWMQVMLDEDDKFYIIEMGYRLPGDMTTIPYKKLFEFDVTKWLVDLALGDKWDISQIPQNQVAAFTKTGCSYSLWSDREGTLKSLKGLDELLKDERITYYSLNHIGDHFAYHRPIGVLAFASSDIDEMCSVINKINNTLYVEDQNGENSYIKYTDFDYLRELYNAGLRGE